MSNRPDLTTVIWKLIELKDFVEDQQAAQHLASALRRLTVLRDHHLIMGERR
jgi:hypothetical protein